MYSRATLLCGFLCLLTFSGISQSFSTFSSGTGVFYPTSDWADFNNDGYLDLLVTGNVGSSNVNSNPNPTGATLLYQNQNGTGFTEVQSTLIPDLPALSNSAVAWGDFNQDGWMDFAISGNQGGVKRTLLYKNNGPGQNFSFNQTTNWFPGLDYGSISWNDFNNDGYPDLFLSGLDSLKQERSLLFSNNGPDQGFSFSQLSTNLIGFQKGSSDWADYNHDGFDDLLLTGINKTYTTLNSNNHTSTPYLYGGTLIYTNFGNGEFQLASFNCNPNGNGNLGYLGNAVWGDFNNDGYADLISVGSEYGGSALFKNNQNGSFSTMNGTGLPALNTARARCADYNNDGWLDLAITGMSPGQGGLFTMIENVYINNKNNTFSGTSNAGLAYMYYSDLNWADFDNDGHLDLFLAGVNNSSTNQCIFYKNTNSQNYSTPPASNTPQNTNQWVLGSGVLMKWDELSDPSQTYNLYLTNTTTQEKLIVSNSNTSNGQRKKTGTGNTGHETNRLLRELDPGEYQWGVQAINAAWQGSQFTPTGNFSIPGKDAVATIQIESGSTTFCDGSGPELKALSYPEANRWQWYRNGGPISGATSQTYQANSSGSYTVYVSGIANDGSSFNLESSEVNVSAYPSVGIPVATVNSVCPGDSSTFHATPGTNGDNCYWYQNNTLLYTGTDFKAVLQQSTTFTVYSFNSSTGCRSQNGTTVTATIFASPSSPMVSSPSICDSTSATLVASVGANTTCLWYSSSGSTTPVYSGNPYTTPVLTNSVYYYVAAQDNTTGCISSKRSVYVQVVPVPGQPTVQGSYRCSDGPVTLTASPGSNATTCNWYRKINDAIPFFTGLTYTTGSLSRDTLFFVSSTSSNSQCESNARIPVKVEINPEVTLPYAPDQTGYVSRNGNSVRVQLYARTGNYGTTCRWYSSASKSQLLYTDDNYLTPAITSTTTYYVATYDPTSGCESSGTTPVKANVALQPNRLVLPDQVFPSTSIPGDQNENGINLCTGDVIMQQALGQISAGEIGYELKAQYNSRSAAMTPFFTVNPLGGLGWKLLDYPKIAYDDVEKRFFYLDGTSVYQLDTLQVQGNSVVLHASGKAWQNQFILDAKNVDMDQRSWIMRTIEGVFFSFKQPASSGLDNNQAGNIWNLSVMGNSQGRDSLVFSYNSSNGFLNSITSSDGNQLDLSYANNTVQYVTQSVTGTSGAIPINRTVLTYDQNKFEPSTSKSILVSIGEETNSAARIGGSAQWVATAPPSRFTYATSDYAGALQSIQFPAGGYTSYTYGNQTHNGMQYHPVSEVSSFSGTSHVVSNQTVPDQTTTALSFVGGNQVGSYLAFNRNTQYPGVSSGYQVLNGSNTSFEQGTNDQVFRDISSSQLKSDYALSGRKSYFFDGYFDDIILHSKTFTLDRKSILGANDSLFMPSHRTIGEPADTVVVSYYIYDSHDHLTVTHYFGYSFYNANGYTVKSDNNKVDTDNENTGQWVQVIQKIPVPANVSTFSFYLMGGSSFNLNYDFYLDEVSVSGAAYMPQGKIDTYFFNGMPSDSLFRLPDAYKEPYATDSILQFYYTGFETGEDISSWIKLKGSDCKPVPSQNSSGLEISYMGSKALSLRACSSDDFSKLETNSLPIPANCKQIRVAFRYSRAQINGLQLRIQTTWPGGSQDTTLTLPGSYYLSSDYFVFYKEINLPSRTSGSLDFKISVVDAGVNKGINNCFVDNLRIAFLGNTHPGFAPAPRYDEYPELFTGLSYCKRALKSTFAEINYGETYLYPVSNQFGGMAAMPHSILEIENNTALTYSVLRYNDYGLPSEAIQATPGTNNSDENIFRLTARKLNYAPDFYPALGPDSLHLIKPIVMEQNLGKVLGDASWQVISSVMTEWKNFGTSNTMWQPWRTFNLNSDVSIAELDAIPTRIQSNSDYTPPANQWELVSEVQTYTEAGNIQRSMDADSISSFAIYSEQQFVDPVSTQTVHLPEVAIASFKNATEGNAFYYGFENYETHPGTFTQLQLAHSYTFMGSNSCQNTMQMGFALDQTGANSNTYVLEARVLPASGSVRFQVIGASQTYLDQTITYSSSQQGTWNHVDLVFPISAQTDSLQFIITPAGFSSPTYLDDLRFGPALGGFGATVVETPGLNPIGSLGNNGNYQRILYDNTGKQSAQTQEDEQPYQLEQSAYSCSVVANNNEYNPLAPNTTLQIQSKGGGTYYSFNAPNQAQNWTMSSNTRLISGGVQIPSSSNITLKTSSVPSQLNDFVLTAQLALNLSGNSANQATVYLGNNSLQLSNSNGGRDILVQARYSNGNQSDAYMTIAELASGTGWYPIDLTILVFGNQATIWINGQLLPSTLSFSTSNQSKVQIASNRGTLNVYNLQIIEDPIVAVQFSDGLGQGTQYQLLDGKDLIVSETLYDQMMRPAIQTKMVRFENQKPGYIDGFVTSFDYTNGQMQGTVDQASAYCTDGNNDNGYFYYRTFYEGSPETNVTAEFQAGKDFAFRTYSNWEKAKRWVYDHTDEIITVAGYTLDAITIILEPEEAPVIIAMDAADLISRFFVNSDDNVDEEVPVTKYYYDNRKLMTEIKLPKANLKKDSEPTHVVSYYYDFDGNNTEIQSPESGVQQKVYNKNGQIRFSQDAQQAHNSRILYFKYDKPGRLLESGYYHSSWNMQALQAQADNPGYPGNNENPNVLRRYAYDGAGDANFGTAAVRNRLSAAYTYLNGQEASAVRYVYDSKGRVINQKTTIKYGSYSTDTLQYQYQYDNLGNLSQIDYPSWQGRPFTVNYTYTKRNQMESIQSSVDGLLLNYTWNPDGSLASKKQSCLNNSFPSIYKYNAPGWLTNVWVGDSITQYYYDSYGHAYPYYLPRFYNYQVNYNFLDGWWNNLWGEAYYNGNISSTRYSPGPGISIPEHKQGFNYNDYGAMDQYYSNFENDGLDAFDVELPIVTTFDANGNIHSRNIEDDGTLTSTYKKYKYKYDDDHNRLNKVNYAVRLPGSVWSWFFGNSNTVWGYDTLRVDYDHGGKINNIRYDHHDLVDEENGKSKLLYESTRVFDFNNFNLLDTATFSDSQGNLTALGFAYNPFGYRMVKDIQINVNNHTQSHRTRFYLRNAQGVPLSELMHSELNRQDTMTYYVHGADGGIEAVFQNQNGTFNSWFILRDNRGSALQMVNRSNRTMDASWGYSDYGKLYPTYLTNSTKHHYLYTGQEYDPEIGIYNYKARMFDPWLNIFLSPDPAMESPAAPYSYVGNDPINNVDPSGMIPVELEREILEAYKAERMTARDAEMAARIVDNPALRYKKIIKRKAFGVIPYPYLYRGRKDCFFCTLVSEMKETNLTPQDMKQIYKNRDILKHRNFAYFYYDRPDITEIDWEAKYNMLSSQYSALPDRANNVDELIGYLKEHPNGSKFSIGTTIEYPGTERSNGHAFKAEIFTYKDQNWVIFRDFQRGGEPKLKPLFSDRVNYTDMDAYLHKNRAGQNGF